MFFLSPNSLSSQHFQHFLQFRDSLQSHQPKQILTQKLTSAKVNARGEMIIPPRALTSAKVNARGERILTPRALTFAIVNARV